MAAPKITLLSNPNRTASSSPNTKTPNEVPKVPAHTAMQQPVPVIPGTDIPISLHNPNDPQIQNNLASSPDEIDYLLVTALADPGHRFFILKLDRELENFLRDPTIHILEFPPMSTFRRLIIHRVAIYFKLEHHVSGNPNTSRRPVILFKTQDTRIPNLRLSELTTQEEQTQKKVKILNRSVSAAKPASAQEQSNFTNSASPTLSTNPTRISQAPKRKKIIVSDVPSDKEQELETANDTKVLTQREVDYAKARARIFDEPFNEDEYTIIPDPTSPETVKQISQQSNSNSNSNSQVSPSQPASGTIQPGQDPSHVSLTNEITPSSTIVQNLNQTKEKDSQVKISQATTNEFSQNYRLQSPPPSTQVNTNNVERNLSRPCSEPRLSPVNCVFSGYSTPQFSNQTSNWPSNPSNNYHTKVAMQPPYNMSDRLSPDHFNYRPSWNSPHPQGNPGAPGYPIYAPFPPGDYRQQPPSMMPVGAYADVRGTMQPGFPSAFVAPTYSPYGAQHVSPSQNNFNPYRGMNDSAYRNTNANVYSRKVGPVLYDFSETTPGNPVEPIKAVPSHILELADLNPQTPKDDPGIEEIRRRNATIKKLGNKGLFIAVFKTNKDANELKANSTLTTNFRLIPWSGKLT